MGGGRGKGPLRAREAPQDAELSCDAGESREPPETSYGTPALPGCGSPLCGKTGEGGKVLWKWQLCVSRREVSLLPTVALIYSLLLALGENTTDEANTRALVVNMCGVDRWAVGMTLKPLAGWSLWLPPVKEGSRKQGKVSARGLLMLSSLVQTFVPSRFARPGWEGRQMSAFIKPTRPFAVSS